MMHAVTSWITRFCGFENYACLVCRDWPFWIALEGLKEVGVCGPVNVVVGCQHRFHMPFSVEDYPLVEDSAEADFFSWNQLRCTQTFLEMAENQWLHDEAFH